MEGDSSQEMQQSALLLIAVVVSDELKQVGWCQ